MSRSWGLPAAFPGVGHQALTATGVDVVGDIHGCHAELLDLLSALGYRLRHAPAGHLLSAVHPDRRCLVLAGDLVDRGPEPLLVLRTALALTDRGPHAAGLGNHDAQLLRWLWGALPPRQIYQGSGLTRLALEGCTAGERGRIRAWLGRRPHHLVLRHPSADLPPLVVAHTGIPRACIGRDEPEVGYACVYEAPMPREVWHRLGLRQAPAADFRHEYDDPASPMLVFGHWPVQAPYRLQRTIAIDTGCCYGTALSAYRWPEDVTMSVPSRQPTPEPLTNAQVALLRSVV